jgi:superfamily II RNA helicase
MFSMSSVIVRLALFSMLFMLCQCSELNDWLDEETNTAEKQDPVGLFALSDEEINILIASVIYEPRRKDYFTLKGNNQTYAHIMRNISNKGYVMKNLNKLHVKRMIRVIGDFTNGCEFKDLLDMCNLDEGDLIRLFRRVIDMIRQIRQATYDHDLIDKLYDCQERIYRDVIKFEF